MRLIQRKFLPLKFSLNRFYSIIQYNKPIIDGKKEKNLELMNFPHETGVQPFVCVLGWLGLTDESILNLRVTMETPQ
jgi:hypothetical protein